MLSPIGFDTKAKLCIITQRFRSSNWISSLSAASVLGVAGFVFALKQGRFRNSRNLYLVSEKEQDSRDVCFFVPGLQNLGNNCFLNVILQALASCKDFRVFLQWVIEDWRERATEEKEDIDYPLTFALFDLLEEICTITRRETVSSPRKVMQALGLYVKNFNLTSQQDAAEALLHLISSLQEEIVDRYRPNPTTLLDIISSPNMRVLSSSQEQDSMELKRWQKHLSGPFNGIFGSMLTCKTCSSQIALEFQFFHTLPLFPLIDSGSNIIYGCTLANCLKKFFNVEKLENYFCSRCWHNAAIRYLSVKEVDEGDIEKLRNCGKDENCDCKTVLHLERMPWSNSFSHTLKQLTIARCPKLLCIQVQRASVNMYGESVKLSGHIAFPLILDLSAFSLSTIGLNIEENRERSLQMPRAINYFRQQTEQEKRASSSMAVSPAEPDHESSPNPMVLPEELRNCNVYRLVTVVEHFGRTGSGHYIVYRSVRHGEEDCDDESKNVSWFGISDSKVYRVSESDVLGAEASLLFYERI